MWSPCFEGTKIYVNGQGHITKFAAMPVYGKTFKTILEKS